MHTHVQGDVYEQAYGVTLHTIYMYVRTYVCMYMYVKRPLNQGTYVHSYIEHVYTLVVVIKTVFSVDHRRPQFPVETLPTAPHYPLSIKITYHCCFQVHVIKGTCKVQVYT